MKTIKDGSLLFSVFLLCGLIIGCTGFADPTGPKSSLVVGRVMINNQYIGQLSILDVGKIERGLELEIKSQDESKIITATTEPGGYFMISNIPPGTYYISKVILIGNQSTASSQLYEEYHMGLPKGRFFTPAPGKALDIGGYSLEISQDGRMTGNYLSADPESARSHVSKSYPGTSWLKRAFISAP